MVTSASRMDAKNHDPASLIDMQLQQELAAIGSRPVAAAVVARPPSVASASARLGVLFSVVVVVGVSLLALMWWLARVNVGTPLASQTAGVSGDSNAHVSLLYQDVESLAASPPPAPPPPSPLPEPETLRALQHHAEVLETHVRRGSLDALTWRQDAGSATAVFERLQDSTMALAALPASPLDRRVHTAVLTAAVLVAEQQPAINVSLTWANLAWMRLMALQNMGLTDPDELATLALHVRRLTALRGITDTWRLQALDLALTWAPAFRLAHADRASLLTASRQWGLARDALRAALIGSVYGTDQLGTSGAHPHSTSSSVFPALNDIQAGALLCNLFLVQMFIADWSHYDHLWSTAHTVALRQRECFPPLYVLHLPFPLVFATRVAHGESMMYQLPWTLSSSASPLSTRTPVLLTARPHLPAWPGHDQYAVLGSDLSNLSRRRHRLRVGYLSSDLYAHPVGRIHRQLFALHDRSRVKVFVYASRAHHDSADYAFIRQHADQFTDVSGLADRDAAAVMVAHRLHVLIDMNGLTVGHRAALLSLRPAPVIVCALGYWGPCASPWSPYLVVDPVVAPTIASIVPSIPVSATGFATSAPTDAARIHIRPLMLPRHVLFVSRPAASDLPAVRRKPRQHEGEREEYELAGEADLWSAWQLPTHQFAFCNFGKYLKLNPTVWAVWMRILQRVPDSVLWLLRYPEEDGERAIQELRAAADRLGVASARIFVTALMPLPEMLKVKSFCSLYLDTSPYASHSTAGEALYASTPIVTLLGDSLMGRLAASAVMAADVNETVVATLQQYEDVAVNLATSERQGLLRQMRDRLTTHIHRTHVSNQQAPFFDNTRWVRDWENVLLGAFLHEWQQQQQQEQQQQPHHAEL